MDATQAYILSKNHANSVALGIASMSVSGTTVTFKTTDGKTAKVTVPTPADGISIKKIDIDNSNHLICTLSDNSTIDAGEIKTIKGADGNDGITFVPSVDANGNLSWTNNGGKTNPTTINIKGEKGDAFTYDDFTEDQLAALKGDKGDQGTAPTITVNTNTDTEYKLDITDENGTITTPNLKGSGGDGNTNLSDYYTKEDVDDLVPTKTSELENDSKYVTETDLDEKGYLTEHQDISKKVDKTAIATTISEESTHEQVASAKAVYDAVKNAVENEQADGKNLIQPQNMEQGSCDYSIGKPYTPNTMNNRVRIKLLDAEPNADYTMVCPSGYYMTIHCYDSNKIALCDVSWRTGTYTFKSHSNAKYFGAVFKNSDSSDFSVSEAANIKFKLERGNKATITPEDLQSQIDTSKKLLDDIANASKLTPSEKVEVNREWLDIKTEYSKYESQCKNYSVSYTAYKNAYDTLDSYLNTTNSGVIFSMNTTTDISREEFNNKFATYYSYKVDMINSLEYAKAKKEADNILSQREIYSTSEQLVGTWIDGKPLYQKTIDFGSLPNATVKSVNHNIANVEMIMTVMDASYVNKEDIFYPVLYLSIGSATNAWNVKVDKTAVSIQVGVDRSDFNAIVTVRYTKTTD